ncbi:MAG: methyltransferase [Planctomycetaceae bacterium]|nr:methyltransferase [Planctomycetaceae bacterium]
MPKTENLRVSTLPIVTDVPVPSSLNVDEAVRDRYSQAAQEHEVALCCPVDYDAKYLEMIPQEIIDRDYGCGDPSKFVDQGDTVLDLGSGGGKICYIASQVVGAEGKVIGVDCNDDMLGLARQYRGEMAEKLGYGNVEFRKGKIQDLQLDLELLDKYLLENSVRDSSDWLKLEEHADSLRQSAPLIEDQSIDVIVSNCVLNLVKKHDRRQLFDELYRVLKRGGRAVISDIVCDEDIPEHLQNDERLWSGCISGAHREDEFLDAFADAGFYGMEVLSRQEEPWAVIEGIEFRSMTVRAYRGKDGPCLERAQAVVYNGPWKSVTDDDGHKLVRGQRMAVCDKTFQIYSRKPYADQITSIEPHALIPLEEAQPMSCHGTPTRLPQETKSGKPRQTQLPGDDDCCGPSCC